MDRMLTISGILLCCIVGVLGMDGELAELAKMLRDECVQETGVDVGLIDKVN